MNVSFYCRASKADRYGLSPIEICVILNGKRVYIATQMKMPSKDFAKDMASKRDNQTKQFCHTQRQVINNALSSIMSRGEGLSVYALKEFVKYGDRKPYTAGEMESDFLAALRTRIGRDLKQITYNKYVSVLDMFFKSFPREKPASAIDNRAVTEFYASLSDYVQSSSAGMMTKIKTFIKYGLDNGHITVNPFSMVRIHKGKPKEEFLTVEEIDRIASKPMPCKRLEQVRDCFLFQASTGLSYSDIAALRPEDINVDKGVFYIAKKRVKNGQDYCTVILPMGVEMLRKYDYRIPVLSDQKYNAYLKEIGDICGVEKNLHTHLARKTFATHMRRAGCGYDLIARMLGHSSTKITESSYAFLETTALLQQVSPNLLS